MQLPYTILYALKKINGERTSSSVYHLLKGKRSSQTLQDGHMFRLSFLFGVCKKMNRHEYDEQIRRLLTEYRIKKIEENTYVLTAGGDDYIHQHQTSFSLPEHMDGLQYGERGDVFWKRLSLIVQTVSHLQQDVNVFLPIQQDMDITAWVRQFLLSNRSSRAQLARHLYDECSSLLSSLSELEANIFVMRLSGKDRIGWTNDQIALLLQQDPFRVHLLFIGTLHFIVKAVQEHEYPLLKQIASYGESSFAVLSVSTQKTYTLWRSGKTMEEIARIRHLKVNTVEDHFVEIAIHDKQFPLQRFVSKEKQGRIVDASAKLRSRKLRALKEYIGDGVSYFEIRLVLARMGDTHES